jgi:hypothetical protein
MRLMILACVVAVSLMTISTWAGEASTKAKEVQAQFNKAFSEGSSSDKKDALRSAQSLSKEDDDVAFELLIKGVNDRQVHDEAVLALRARTGLQPTLLNRGTGFPGYPASDDASEWNNWLATRKKVKETEGKIKENEKKLKDLEAAKNKPKGDDAKGTAKADGKTETPADGTTPPATGTEGETPIVKAPPTYVPPSDLGQLDRIIFKSGGTLVCYILSKRVNADGVLQSVRVVHPNNGGEEILTTDLISRIDEDIR